MLEVRADIFRCKRLSAWLLEDDGHDIVANMSFPQQLETDNRQDNRVKLIVVFSAQADVERRSSKSNGSVRNEDLSETLLDSIRAAETTERCYVTVQDVWQSTLAAEQANIGEV